MRRSFYEMRHTISQTSKVVGLPTHELVYHHLQDAYTGLNILALSIFETLCTYAGISQAIVNELKESVMEYSLEHDSSGSHNCRQFSSSAMRLYLYKELSKFAPRRTVCLPNHVDLGLVTIAPKSSVPCLQIFPVNNTKREAMLNI